jgi:hypothetical membrane protein
VIVKAAAACWLVAGIAYLSLEAIAAHALPGYGYAHNFISDLGRPDSPLSPLMNGAFVVQGTLFFAGAALVARAALGRHARLFVGCAAANAIGNVVVASVPSGSALAGVHVAGAALAILAGNAAILPGAPMVKTFVAHRFYGAASYGLAALGLLSFALLAVASTARIDVVLPAAVFERTSVYTIIVWQMMSALQLLLERRRV